MNIAFAHPWVLVLLLFALLPFIAGIFNKRLTSWNQLIPASNTTRWINRLIKILGVLAFISIVLGNETFGGKVPDKATPAKSQVARRLLSEFVNNRPHDLFGVVGFSTQPFFISPLTEHKSATQAAINSLTSPGLAFTNVAKGLGMGLSYFEDQPHTGSRVIVLVSDGAATLDHRAQRVLREWFERYQVSLYWFFLRTENGLGITSEPETARDDNPRVMPERYLDQFFRTLPIPYHAYEVDTPESMEAAIHQLDNLESLPLVYNELIPRNDMTRLCFLTALFAVLSLLGIKALEAK